MNRVDCSTKWDYKSVKYITKGGPIVFLMQEKRLSLIKVKETEIQKMYRDFT